MMDYIDDVRECYNQNVIKEWTRLEQHKVEYEINMRYIKKYIKSGDKVLDIGGGPGRYAIDIAKMGCGVTLFDLSQRNIDFALNKALEVGVNLNVVCGDARFVNNYIGEKFDVVLLMGPLYHMPDEDDRIRTVKSAMKLLKPGGILCAAFISSYAAVWDYLANIPETILDPLEMKFFNAFSNGENYSGVAFTQCHFICPKDVIPFMAQFPLKKLHLLGSESILALKERELMLQPPEVYAKWLDFAEKVCENDEFLNLTHHFLYIGEKQDE